MPTPTTATTTSSIPMPREARSPSATWSPSSTIPARSSFFEAIARPGAAARGSGTTFASTTPTTIARTRALIPGSSGATSIETTATPRASARPGRTEGVGDVEGVGVEGAAPEERVCEGAEGMTSTVPSPLTCR